MGVVGNKGRGDVQDTIQRLFSHAFCDMIRMKILQRKCAQWKMLNRHFLIW